MPVEMLFAYMRKKDCEADQQTWGKRLQEAVRTHPKESRQLTGGFFADGQGPARIWLT